MKSRCVLLTMLLLIVLIPCFADSEIESPLLDKGILNLSGIELVDSDPIRLNGKWEFFWNILLSPEDMADEDLTTNREYINIPGSWTQGALHPAEGYGTFRMNITGLSDQHVYSLYIPDLYTNYRLWINGKELSRNGSVGKSAEESKPQNLPRVISFESHGDLVEILIQMSNYNYRKSGILSCLYFGVDEKIRTFRERNIIFQTFLSGILLAISLFHIGIFLYRKSEKAELIFGLICFSLLIRILTTGEQLLTFYMPNFPWEIIRRLEYLPFYVSAPLAALYFTSLFPGESSKLINRVYIAVCLAIGGFLISFPIRISNNAVVFAEIWLVVGIIYILIIMIKALVHKREGSILMISAFLIFSFAIINDILYAQNLVRTIYLSPLGFVIFLIMQSQMLTRKFTRSFTQREILAKSRDTFRHASITDSLTGLYNVRYLGEVIEKEMLKSIENQIPLSVIMADVDNFKLYNDTWGHKQGDEILKKMGKILRTSARDKDSPCRYGGEEFSVVLPGTTLKVAFEVSERIRLRFETAECDDERMRGITISIGVAQFIPGESMDCFIERADKALYKAKSLGKNRVESAEQIILQSY